MPARLIGAALAWGLVLLGLAACQSAEPPPVPPLDLPPGYALEPYALVPGARSLALGDDGRTLYVGTTDGTVAAVHDQDGDGLADHAARLIEGLDGATSVASGPGGTVHAVDRRQVVRLSSSGRLEVIVPDGVLPGTRSGGHPAAFGPDGRLYVGVPAGCARCALGGVHGTILRMAADGHGLEIFARGARAPAAFDWHPATGELFFADRHERAAGPDELNRAPAAGLHFGYPDELALLSEGGAGLQEVALPSPTFPAVLELEATGTAGLDFYEGSMLPERLRGDALIAVPDGAGPDAGTARLLRVRFTTAGEPAGTEVLGRARPGAGPVHLADLEELPDGSVLLADDRAGVVYRLSYRAAP